MIVSLEEKGRESILAIEGTFLRFGRHQWKNYRYKLKKHLLINWCLNVSNSDIEVWWDEEQFLVHFLKSGKKETYEYSIASIELMMREIARLPGYKIAHYDNDTDCVEICVGCFSQ